MADAPAFSPSAPSTLPPPRPRSPPPCPDLYGRRREIAKLQLLEREKSFLESELKFMEGLYPASRCCKEVVESVGTKPDPFTPVHKKINKPSRVWKWICKSPCLLFSWVCCCGGCPTDPKTPDCHCCVNPCDCGSCTCCCSLPKSSCCCKISCLNCGALCPECSCKLGCPNCNLCCPKCKFKCPNCASWNCCGNCFTGCCVTDCSCPKCTQVCCCCFNCRNKCCVPTCCLCF